MTPCKWQPCAGGWTLHEGSRIIGAALQLASGSWRAIYGDREVCLAHSLADAQIAVANARVVAKLGPKEGRERRAGVRG